MAKGSDADYRGGKKVQDLYNLLIEISGGGGNSTYTIESESTMPLDLLAKYLKDIRGYKAGGGVGGRGARGRASRGGGGPKHGGRDGGYGRVTGDYFRNPRSLANLVQQASPQAPSQPQLPTLSGNPQDMYNLLASRLTAAQRPVTLPDIRQMFPQGTSLPQGAPTGYRTGSPWQFFEGGLVRKP